MTYNYDNRASGQNENPDPSESGASDHDWRLDAASKTVRESSDGRYPAGSSVVAVTLSKNRRGELVSFERPSAAALALNIAYNAATRAETVQQHLTYEPGTFGGDPVDSVSTRKTHLLFDYFEQCIITVTFSFQALEAYGNYIIARKVTTTYPLARKKGDVVRLTAIELERQASTEQKLGDILPDLLRIASPKGKAVWQNFKLLKDKRDATMHIKSVDQAPRPQRPEDMDRASLFMGFIDADILAWPNAAVQLIHYFARRDMVPDWLEHELDRYQLAHQAPK